MIYFDKLFKKYRAKGLLIDTNILLLLLVGLHDRSMIEEYKRTKQFTQDDFDVLTRICGMFRKLITTPSVLAETSNLARPLFEIDSGNFPAVFQRFVSTACEETVKAVEVVGDDLFRKTGFTDTSVKMICSSQFLILTDDFRLSGHLTKQNIDFVNFNHLRLPYLLS